MRVPATTAMSTVLCLWICIVPVAAQPAAAPGAPATRPAPQPIPRIAFDGVPLEQAVESLRSAGGSQIVVDWPALQAMGLTRTTPVTVPELAGASVGAVLDALATGAGTPQAQIGWYVDGGVHVITSAANVAQQRRAVQAVSAALAPRPAAQVDLSTPILDMDQMSLSDAIDYFRAVGRLNIVVNWPSLESVGVFRDTTVSMQVRGMTLGKALDVVLDQVNAGKDRFSRAYWIIDEGVVTIASGYMLDQDMRVRVYDVTDLLLVVPNFRGPRLSLSDSVNDTRSRSDSSSSRYGSLFGDDDDGGDDDDDDSGDDDDSDDDDDDGLSSREQRERTQQTLIQVIQNTIGPEFWQPIGRGSITILNGRMIISQSRLGFKLMDDAAR